MTFSTFSVGIKHRKIEATSLNSSTNSSKDFSNNVEIAFTRVLRDEVEEGALGLFPSQKIYLVFKKLKKRKMISHTGNPL